MNDTAIKAYASIWDALADTPQEAAKLKVRSELMNQMSVFIK
jgi:predicted XRE-type DNA-binding protein